MTVAARLETALRLDLAEAYRLARVECADADTLYRRWFHAEAGVLQTWPQSAAYRAATLHPDAYQDGWTVVTPTYGSAGAVLAERTGRQRTVAPPEVVPADPGVVRLVAGSQVRVHRLAAAESGGFWHVWSVGWQRRAPRHYRRIYLPIAPDGARDVVARVTTIAPPMGSWSLKALCGVHDAGRRDGVVLYLPVRVPLTDGWVARAVAAVRSACVDRLPPFVSPLGEPGGSGSTGSGSTGCPGWAPDPGGGRSFGERVCETVVSAALDTDDDSRFAAAATRAVTRLPGMRSFLGPSPAGAKR